MDEQQATIRFLKAMAPTVIETHISMIFLDEHYAYKLKKALTLPFVDFSQSRQRLLSCQDELRLNRRTATDLYLEVLPIYCSSEGQLSFEDNGTEPVDAVLKMRRFDSRLLLSKLAEQQQLNQGMMNKLADTLATFHQQATIANDPQGAQRLRAVIELNRRSESLVNQSLGHQRMSELNQALLQDTARHAELLDQRAAAGKVRRCHGDLHLNNICLWQDQPTPFDCLEFNESMATTDILYDVAFLLMDLWHYQQYDLANFLMNRYLDAQDETEGLVLLPLFMSLRASIRAMVLAIQAANTSNDTEAAKYRQQAEQFLDLAFNLLQGTSPQLIAIGGLSGSGKSTLAAAIAPFIGTAPGARVLSTDRIRKKLFGIKAEARLPAESYTAAHSARVYHRQRELSSATLVSGYSVIADGVFAKVAERNAIEDCAIRATTPFTGIWLLAPAPELIQRVAKRSNDPSDATVDVVTMQLKLDLGEIHWHQLISQQSTQTLGEQALALIKLQQKEVR